jgi:predicted TIM-barrel fold metal-dependent hydrolase
MMIVDSQVHIWDADTPERPWPKRAEPQRPVPLGIMGRGVCEWLGWETA